MLYRREMRTPSFRKLTASLAGVVLVLAGCGAEEKPPPSAAGPCAIVENGTPAAKTT
jgi:gamma-glutamyltranspeptidase / glutathione hydrolase